MDVQELFSLRKPCADCPFLQKNREMLAPGRLEGIIKTLHDNQAFHCHKTIDYTKRSKKQKLAKAKYCAGSILYLEKSGNINLPLRLGHVFGICDPQKISGHEDVIEPLGLDRYIPTRKSIK